MFFHLSLFTQPFLLFLVLNIVYSQDVQTNFGAKYVKRCGSVQVLQQQNITFQPIFQETATLKLNFDRT